MWLVWKQTGLFAHYLTVTGIFQPGIDRARQFSSKDMAESMSQIYGGTVRAVNDMVQELSIDKKQRIKEVMRTLN